MTGNDDLKNPAMRWLLATALTSMLAFFLVACGGGEKRSVTAERTNQQHGATKCIDGVMYFIAAAPTAPSSFFPTTPVIDAHDLKPKRC